MGSDVNIQRAMLIAAPLLLGACGAGVNNADGGPQPVPDPVIALADPSQNLQTARLRPEDGCYWYLHAGPVETTLIPLRTVEGRPICTASGAATPS